MTVDPDFFQRCWDRWSPEEREKYEQGDQDVKLALESAYLIYKLRTDAGLSQVKMGAAMNKPQTHISRLESGHNVLTLQSLQQACAAVGKEMSLMSLTTDSIQAGRNND